MDAVITDKFTKQQLFLLQNALKHYLQFQIGITSIQSHDYEVMLKVIENKLHLLD